MSCWYTLRMGSICCCILLLTACSGQRVLMPTPSEAVGKNTAIYEELHEQLKTTEVPLVYVTDRVPEKDDDGNLQYGYGRSPSLAFGTTVIDLGEEMTWEELLVQSRTNRRTEEVPMRRISIEEIARGPNAPIPYTEVDGKIVEDPEYYALREATRDIFRQAVVKWLDKTPRKEVIIYVHGFHKSFDDAAFTMAELWHFLGRYGLPIVYTWPSGHPGLFSYTYDRESSEFTVYHFRRLIEYVASFPEVEKINIIAHSRGADIAVNALRELTIAVRAVGNDPKVELKVHNFVLAAPDLDAQVAGQRIIGDFLAWSANRFTIYASPEDSAIGWSRRLFASPVGRVGNLRIEDMTKEIRESIEKGNANFAVINYFRASNNPITGEDGYGHSYFRNAPTVSSDLIIMLRDDVDPGGSQRPLEYIGSKFWRVPPGYPHFDSNP